MKECAMNQLKRKRCLECYKYFIQKSPAHIFCKPDCNKRKNAELKGSSKTKE